MGSNCVLDKLTLDVILHRLLQISSAGDRSASWRTTTRSCATAPGTPHSPRWSPPPLTAPLCGEELLLRIISPHSCMQVCLWRFTRTLRVCACLQVLHVFSPLQVVHADVSDEAPFRRVAASRAVLTPEYQQICLSCFLNRMLISPSTGGTRSPRWTKTPPRSAAAAAGAAEAFRPLATTR